MINIDIKDYHIVMFIKENQIIKLFEIYKNYDILNLNNKKKLILIKNLI